MSARYLADSEMKYHKQRRNVTNKWKAVPAPYLYMCGIPLQISKCDLDLNYLICISCLIMSGLGICVSA